ncbi:hypothetical protein OSJ57_17620 [Sphingomonas sp. HH69]
MFDMAVLAEEIAAIVSDEVAQATAPLFAENKALAARLAALESAAPPSAIKGDPGADGKDADPALIAKMVGAAVAAIPAPVIEAPDIAGAVQQEVSKQIAALPPPKQGDKGDCGVGLAGVFRSEGGSIVVTLSNGEIKDLGSFSSDTRGPTEITPKYAAETQDFAARIALSLGKSVQIDA